MNVLLSWLLHAAIIVATAYLVPGFTVDSFFTAFVLVLILGVLNLIIRPILLLLTLPITLVTLGLFTFVINAFVLYLASILVPGVHINSFFTAIIAAFFISFFSTAVKIIFK